MTLTSSEDSNALCIMVATIYAARMGVYWANAGPKTKESFRAHRQQMIEVSITEAIMICEAVERDFPSDRNPPDADHT